MRLTLVVALVAGAVSVAAAHLTNPALADARSESGAVQPTNIALGESTTDEMCLGAFTFVYKAK